MISPPLAHYILAGGKSRRFGSDKARHPVDGEPMILRVRQAFDSLVDRTFAVAATADAYADLGVNTIADLIPDAGPLGGLLTALTHHDRQLAQDRAGTPTTSPWVLVSSCDLANPDRLNLNPLMDAATTDIQVAVYHNGEFFEPFPGFYRCDLRPHIAELVRRADRSMQHLLRTLGERAVSRRLTLPGNSSLDLDRPSNR